MSTAGVEKDIQTLSIVMTSLENKLEFAVLNFELLYPSKKRFSKAMRLAWDDVQSSFGTVLVMLQENRERLDEVGLAGRQLEFKAAVLLDFERSYDRSWKRYEAWITKVKLKHPNMPYSEYGSRIRSSMNSRRRNVLQKLGRFFGQADTILDTISIIIPNAHGIKEFKETFERWS